MKAPRVAPHLWGTKEGLRWVLGGAGAIDLATLTWKGLQMARAVKVLGLGLAGLLGLLVVGGLLLPASYRMERSILIVATPAEVFPHVNDLRKNAAWSPWEAQDATLKTVYGDTTVGVGATASWTSEHSGNGSMELLRSVPPTEIETALDFQEQGTATSHWRFVPAVGGGTKVTWSLEGDSGWNLIGRYFGFFIDRMVGPAYEDGLKRLKQVVEQAAS